MPCYGLQRAMPGRGRALQCSHSTHLVALLPAGGAGTDIGADFHFCSP